MKIKKLEISGLHGNTSNLCLNFNDDLNILSGRNGAGKTTIIKLMWYLISGNFDKAVAEIRFNSATLTTDKYELNVEINFNNKNEPFSSKLKVSDLNSLKLKSLEKDEAFNRIVSTKTATSWFLTQYIDSSFFMPTFRMIEGGFTTEKYDIKHDVIKEFYLNLNNENDFNDIENSLKKLSHNLTKQNHKFITSISAKDIDIFLVKKYAEIMKKVNINQSENLKLFSNQVMLMKDGVNKNLDQIHILNKQIKSLQQEIDSLNVPLDKVKSAVSNFMPLFNIEFDQKIYFSKVPDFSIKEESYIYDGVNLESPEDEYSDQNNLEFIEDEFPISLDIEPDFSEFEFFDEESKDLTINNLSAGEKQLLTFVAYNIFNNDTIFFIDEPELSLHVDWQNRLFSLLKEQNPTNQFIISTHSPFIYSLFPDKELVIDTDKGCSEF